MTLRRALPLGPALRDRLGPARVVRKLASSPRSQVWQVEFAGTPAIVKQIIGGDDAGRRFDREVTALRLAGAVRPPIVPEVLGTDSDARILVLEYLAASDGGIDDRADDWAIGYATALARLHAAGAGDLPVAAGPGPEDVRAFLTLAGALGVAPVRGAEDELYALTERLGAAGTGALLHGDPCPDNGITTASGVRFVDLEGAASGAGLTELAYLRIGFPTCWCVQSTPEPLLRAAEEAYRVAWRALTRTDPPGDLADACVGWLIQGDALVERAERRTTDHFARMLREDWQWGTMTARERVAYRLGVVAIAIEGRAGLTATNRLVAAMRERMP